MQNHVNIFYSNRLEILCEHLTDALFSNSRPLTKRIILVPSPAIKTWLMFQLAQNANIGIATGIEIDCLHPGIAKLTQLLKAENYQPSFLPSRLEISLSIETHIRQFIHRYKELHDEEKIQWDPLLNYLKIQPTIDSLTKKSQKRLTAISSKLAQLFLNYGTYSHNLILSWEEQVKTEGFSALAWQQQLWLSLFSSSSPFSYLAQTLATFTFPPTPPTSIQVHVFGISHISNAHHQFLTRMANILPVSYFQLSPCSAFWTDIKSDKQNMRLKAFLEKKGTALSKLEALDEYLRDQNSLLANFGKLGREMATLLEESGGQIFESYSAPELIHQSEVYADLLDPDQVSKAQGTSENRPSLLDYIQTDMLVLRNPENQDKVDFSNEDNSIQIHVTSSKMRETEVLYDVLMNIIEKHRHDQEPITPQDILVMAPDIMPYEAYIKAVFGKSSSQLDYQIMDLDAAAKSPLVQGFMHLLNLPSGRWDISAIMQLFDNPSFQSKHGLTIDEVSTIREWLREAGIRWGETAQHRDALLKRDHCLNGTVEKSPVGTWEEGIARLLLGLLMSTDIDSRELTTLPLQHIDLSQSELIGKVLRILDSLSLDLKPLSQGLSFSLSEWSHYLSCTLEAYFDIQDKESQEGSEILLNIFSQFQQTSKHIPDASFGFISIKQNLEILLNQQKIHCHESHLQAVRFSSFLPMRTIPAKVVVLLDMEEGSFPRPTPPISLNLMVGEKMVDYCPTSTDFDRYLFLEAILSARNYLIISYSSSPSSTKESASSLVVSELLDYLDKAYTIQGEKISAACQTAHPLESFNSCYFDHQDPKFMSYSYDNYLAAKAYYQPAKKLPHRFLSDYWIDENKTKELKTGLQPDKEICLNIKQLTAIARNPLKAYFNRTLGIYINGDEEHQLKIDEDFVLSKLEAYLLKQKALKKPLERVLDQAKKSGKFPQGTFKTLAFKEMANDIQEVHDNLSKMGVSPKDIFEIEFDHQCDSPRQTDEGNWIVPALDIHYRDQITIKIVGKLDTVTPQGLIVHGKDSLKDVIKFWPQYLLLNSLSHPNIKASSLLLTKHDKPKESFFEDPKILLSHYLDYYFLCLQNASPLIPEWVPDILKHDVDNFTKKIYESVSNTSTPLYNPYVHWAFAQKDPINNQELFKVWKNQAEHLFGNINNQWFSK